MLNDTATLLSNVAPNPTHHGVEPRLTGRVARPRHRLREEEHAALAVLDDWELLVSYAVKNGLVRSPPPSPLSPKNTNRHN